MPSLLPVAWLQALLLLGAMLMGLAQIAKNNFAKILSILLLGFCYGQFYGHAQMQQLWRITDPREVTLSFDVSTLVEPKGHYQKFAATVVKPSQYLLGQKLLLNAYLPITIKPCTRYQAVVRLKPIHGLQNPAGFDYYSYLFAKGIKAKGYVKTVIRQKPSASFCVHSLRQAIKTKIEHKFENLAPWVLALSIGDKSGFEESHWQLLKETATGHLFVVSGLHIGLIAFAVFYAVLAIRRLGFGLLFMGDWRPLAYVLGFSAALFYALLAGFTLPTQRALIMLWVFFFGQFLGVRINVWLRFNWALLLLLVIQPNAFLNGGFVLSFMALFFVLSLGQNWPKAKSWHAKLGLLLLWQLLLSVLLMPLLYGYFDYWPLLSPLYNFFAIPWVTFLVLPWLLLGLALWWLFDVAFLLHLASFALQLFISALEQAHSYLNVSVDLRLGFWQLLVISVALTVVLVKPYRKYWPVALVLLIVVTLGQLFTNKPQPIAKLHVIDVGQGLSVLVQSQGQSLLVDLGSRWQTGSMVKIAVLPQLKAQGIKTLDHLVISHHDNDHLGDVNTLLDKVPAKNIYSHSLINAIGADKQKLCRQGQHFSLGAVKVKVISPKMLKANTENDRSCVLLLNVAGHGILLPGDISADKERDILPYLPKHMQLLLLAHHGSRYSSSEALLRRFENGTAIASAGFLNPFKHPHPDVQKRLQAQHIKLLNTAKHGLVQWQINADGTVHIKHFAKARGFGYW